MKFGKLLNAFQEEEGDGSSLQPPTLDYKKLKKLLKAMKAAGPSAAGFEAQNEGAQPALHVDDERLFMATLNEDVGRINEFFMEREEEAVIRLKELEDRLASAGGSRELSALSSALIDFHGEMVLLLHWSLVNYAAVAKILKKHDKLTGSLLRYPYMSNVLHQPFLSTEAISRLVKQAEEMVNQLAGGTQAQQGQAEGEEVGGEGQAVGIKMGEQEEAGGEAPKAPQLPQQHARHARLVKRTQAALGMLQQLQDKASTPSTLLPPAEALVSETGAAGKRQRVAGPETALQ